MTYKKKNKKSRFKLGNTERDILDEISAGDMFVGFLLSCRSTSRMYKIAYSRAAMRGARKRSLDSIKKKGLVRISGERVALTKLGKRIVQQHKITDVLSKNKRKWDGKWRVVSFDIPNEMGHVRSSLRSLLNDAGFLKVQQSVYVYPHKCEQLFNFINSDKKWAKYITFMVAEYANNNKEWEKEFKHLFV